MRLPAFLKDYIPPDAVKQFSELVNQPALLGGLKEAAQRLGWKESWQPKDLQDAMRQARRWVDSFSRRQSEASHSVQSVINATGEVFGSRWVSLPLDRLAVQSLAIASGGFVEDREWRDRLHARIAELCHAEDAVVLNSLPQALQCISRLPAITQDWVIAKADCIRLGEEASLNEWLGLTQRRVTEIGAANACTQQDLQSGIRLAGQAFFAITPSVLPGNQASWTEYADHAIRIARHIQTITVELHLLGHWLNCDEIPFDGKVDVPVISQRIQAGADLVLLPSHGMIGGPEGWIVVGKNKHIREIKRLAALHGAWLPKISGIALIDAVEAASEWSRWIRTPLGAMLTNSIENLQYRATRLLVQLEGSPLIETAQMDSRSFPLGDGLWGTASLPSPAIRLRSRDIEGLQRKLKTESHSVIAKVDGDQLILVMRTIDPDEDRDIAAVFQAETKEEAGSTTSAEADASIGLDG